MVLSTIATYAVPVAGSIVYAISYGIWLHKKQERGLLGTIVLSLLMVFFFVYLTIIREKTG